VSKATGRPIAKLGAQIMTGRTLRELGATQERVPAFYSVKEAVFPFVKFPEADPILGPEMKSTGEVMGTGRTFGEAYAKAQSGSGVVLPRSGLALISVRERDKPGAVLLARRLIAHGFQIVATEGTAKVIPDAGWVCSRATTVREGRTHIVDMIKNGDISLIVNTTEGKQALSDSRSLRRAALLHRVPYYTTLAGSIAATEGIKAYLHGDLEVCALQDYFH
jgi:carbamoyl-phosphate synthase large subunit